MERGRNQQEEDRIRKTKRMGGVGGGFAEKSKQQSGQAKIREHKWRVVCPCAGREVCVFVCIQGKQWWSGVCR